MTRYPARIERWTSSIHVGRQERFVSDSTIEQAVGRLTYLHLYLLAPELYRPVASIRDPRKYLVEQAEKGYRSRVTEIEAWDDLEPLRLKFELVKVLVGLEADPRARSLLGSSEAYPLDRLETVGSWLMVIFLAIVIWATLGIGLWRFYETVYPLGLEVCLPVV